MTATPVALNTITRAGLAKPTPIACDAANGNSVSNGSTVHFEFTNSDTASHTVTVQQPGTLDGVTSPGKVYTIAAGVTLAVGVLPQAIYGQTVTWTVDNALVKYAVYQLAM